MSLSTRKRGYAIAIAIAADRDKQRQRGVTESKGAIRTADTYGLSFNLVCVASRAFEYNDVQVLRFISQRLSARVGTLSRLILWFGSPDPEERERKERDKLTQSDRPRAGDGPKKCAGSLSSVAKQPRRCGCSLQSVSALPQHRSACPISPLALANSYLSPPPSGLEGHPPKKCESTQPSSDKLWKLDPGAFSRVC